MNERSEQKMLIALSKGRVLKEALPLLEAAGLAPRQDMGASRSLIFDAALDGVRLLLLRGADVPTYVEFGAADMGIVGRDVLLEYGSGSFYEPLDLKTARCRMMTAKPAGASDEASTADDESGAAADGPRRLRVATKFVNVAKRHFAGQGRQIQLIPLGGALELAPAMGLADAIVDIVDTGGTLKANGLEPGEVIAHISSRVIVNKAAMKLKGELIAEILDRLEQVVPAE